MPRRFLPSLLGGKAHPAQEQDEVKAILADYYNTLAASGVWSPSRTRPWPIHRAVTEGYERIIWVFKAVEALAGSAARLPFELKRGDKAVEDHPLYAVLNKRANPMETGRQFRKRLTAQVLLSKAGAFVEVTRSRGGDIIRMDLLPPGRTRPVPGEDGSTLVDHYEVVRSDGSRRHIPAENVRWFREPHPIDPYSGVTPLEAAGMSVELDFFARLYNVAFLKNDGRPGGVLAIDGEMEPSEMDRVEARFGAGPTEAGRLSVINGAVSYIDLATRPRDMQHEQTAKISKTEILTAFGVPESILGFSADRTYANAEQEALNFWTVTMPPLLDLLATGFDEDSNDDLETGWDTSGITVLHKPDADQREEARKEFDLGLITVAEYRKRAGYDEIDMPDIRCIYIPAGKTKTPTSEADAKKIEAAKPQPPALLPPGSNAALPPGQRATAPPNQPPPGGQQSRSPSGLHGGQAPPVAPTGTRRAALAAVKALPSGESKAPKRVMRLVRPRASRPAPAYAESEPDPAALRELEIALTEALTALVERLGERAIARLASPKARKGTRHWNPDLSFPSDTRIGTKAIDGTRVVDEERWGQEAEDAVRPLVQAAAQAAALGLLGDLAVTVTPNSLDAIVAAGATEIVAFVGGWARRQAERLAFLINDADQVGESFDDISFAIRAQLAGLEPWLAAMVAQVAVATIASGRESAAHHAGQEDSAVSIARVWRSHHDDRVRPSHAEADGQIQDLGSPFIVGDALLRYPGDPFGPPGEVANCRCGLHYRLQAASSVWEIPSLVGAPSARR